LEWVVKVIQNAGLWAVFSFSAGLHPIQDAVFV
jgi:hypothetical protein